MSDSDTPQTVWPARLLCPWDFPGKNTGVDCHSLFQRIFPTQGLNSGLLHCRQILYYLSYREVSPKDCCHNNSEFKNKYVTKTSNVEKNLSLSPPREPWSPFSSLRAPDSFSSVQFSHSVVSNSLRPPGLQHTRAPCPSPAPGVYSNSCPLSW